MLIRLLLQVEQDGDTKEAVEVAYEIPDATKDHIYDTCRKAAFQALAAIEVGESM